MCKGCSGGVRPIRGTGGAAGQKSNLRYKMSPQRNPLIYIIIQTLSRNLRYKI